MKTRKAFSLILAMAVLGAMALPITAYAGSITITPPTGASVASQQFRAYQIFTAEADTDATATATGYVYELNPAYTGFETDYASLLGGLGLKDYILAMLDGSGDLLPGKKDDLEGLARALWNWSEANNVANVKTATGTATGVRFANLDAGYYIVAGEALFYPPENNPATTFAALITVLEEDEDLVVPFKASAPRIEKEVFNHHSDDWEKWTDVSITDTVSFKLTSTIPDTRYYESYVYKIIDTMSKGLTFGEIISVTAYKAGEPGRVIPPANYTLAGPAAFGTVGETRFSVTIDSDLVIELSEAGYERIEVIFSAVLNEDAVIEGVGNPNYVYLEYSNNPNWEGQGTPPTGETPEDDAWVYTYKLNVFKYTVTAGDEIPLQGALFQLFPAVGNQVASFIKGAGGVYIFQGFIPKPTPPADGASEADIATYEALLASLGTLLESDADGMIYIVGIDEGTYILHEFKAPQDYNAAPDVTVMVYNKLSLTVSDLIAHLNEQRGKANTGDSLVDVVKDPDNDTELEQVAIYNGKGPQFPITGSVGTIIFYLAAGVLTAGLIVFFIVRRRRNILDDKSTA